MKDAPMMDRRASDRSRGFEGVLAAVGLVLIPLLIYPLFLDFLRVPLQQPRSTFDEILVGLQLPLLIALFPIIGWVFRKYGRIQACNGFIISMCVLFGLVLLGWLIPSGYRA
ncbi:hypothetical protein [Dyella silvatica]|uniref:hypothetical protein n=1 Tax=Dyella silvatica TaxID=2992128 RepID=UPI00225C0D9B|nr:hypothetical protein [Dyella silvatica]